MVAKKIDTNRAFCIPQFSFVFEWQFGYTQVIQITIWPFTLKNINIFILKCLAKLPFGHFQ